MAARPVVQDRNTRFDGGLNISADPSQLAPNQVRRAENCRLTVFGGIIKRFGSRKLHATALQRASVVRAGFAWIKDDGTQQLLAVAAGKLHTATYSSSVTWVTVSSTVTMTTSAYPSFVSFRDASTAVVYIADGGKLMKWDGTNLTRSTSSPNVTTIWLYNQRLYGVAGNDVILLVSGINNGDDLGDASLDGAQFPIITFGESSLVGGVALGVMNLLFHKNGISKFVGVTQDDIAIRAGTLGLSPDVGTIQPKSVLATETEAYFLSDRGFYAANAYGVRRISTTLDPDILSLFTNSNNLCVVHNRAYREVAWYLPDVGFYVYNYQAQAWVGPWNNGYVSPVTHCAWQAVDTATTKPIVLVGDSTGYVKQMDYPNTYKDNVATNGSGGTAVTMTAQLRRLFFGNPASTKALRFLYALTNLGGATNTAVAWSTQTYSGQTNLPLTSAGIWNATGATWNSGAVWGASGSDMFRVQAAGNGEFVDISFTDSSTNAVPLLSAMTAEAFDYGQAHSFN